MSLALESSKRYGVLALPNFLIQFPQGAAQAIEDGAVLGVVLGKLTDKKGLHAALKVYEVSDSPSFHWFK